MNVVPTQRTRQIAQHMIRTAVEETGADAVVRLLGKVDPEQVPALVGLLLTNTKVQARQGRPRLPLVYTEAERRECNNRYKKGLRDEWTLGGWREYQRVYQQRRSELERNRAAWTKVAKPQRLTGIPPILWDNGSGPERCGNTSDPGLDQQSCVRGSADRG